MANYTPVYATNEMRQCARERLARVAVHLEASRNESSFHTSYVRLYDAVEELAAVLAYLVEDKP